MNRRSITMIVYGFAVVLACWPAIFNGYPLLYPDTLGYREAGQLALRTLATMHWSGDLGDRSVFYSLFCRLISLGVSCWPIVVVQAGIATYVLYETYRAIMLRASPAWFIVAVVCLCLLTPYPWVASRAMPDIFTPLAILSVFLLLFGGAERPRIRQAILLSVILAAVSFHKSNILIIGGIVPLLVVLAYARRSESRPMPQITCLIVAVVVLGIGMDRSLSASRGGYTDLPYMVARLVADGPAKLYLQETCPEHRYLLCGSLDRLPSDSDEFLFHTTKYLDDVSRPARLRLRQEEWPIVVGTVTTHPIYVLRIVAANLVRLFITFDLSDYRNYPEFSEALPADVPTDYSQVAASRQVNDRLGLPVFTATNAIAMALSVIVLFVIWCVSRPSNLRLNWLAATIVLGVLMNGFVCGVLSGPFPRLQARVVWLLPFLAYLACALICERHTRRRDLAPDLGKGSSVAN